MVSDTAYSPSPPPPAAENHRKRRRNRTRVSCLNCYASKRKCDRKRPCTRCIKHGLTGLCFYELDDPHAAGEDETTRLRRRIAELESVVRELNNRPHPRWTAPGGVAHRPRTRARASAERELDAFFAAESEAAPAPAIKLEPAPEPAPVFTPTPTPAPARASPFGSPLTPLLADLFAFAPSPDPDPDPDPAPHASAATQTSPEPEPAPELEDPPCGCLAAATLHSPLVHLASALRASRDALAASHAPGAPCLLLRRIAELDAHIFSADPAPPAPAPEPEPALELVYPDADAFAFLDYDWT